MSDVREAGSAARGPEFDIWNGPFVVGPIEIKGMYTVRLLDGTLIFRFVEPEQLDCQPDHVVEGAVR